MRSANFTTITKRSSKSAKGDRQYFDVVPLICLLISAFALSLNAQTLAVISPDPGSIPEFATNLSENLSDQLEVLDTSLVASAFKAVKHPDPFNMTTDEAKTTALAIGCDFLVLIRTGNQRRTSFERPEYYESFAAIYVVSSRTGRLVYWTMRNAEEISQSEADVKLIGSSPAIARDLVSSIREYRRREIIGERPANIDEPPLPGTPEAKGFVAPVPYRRIKPEYTTTAYLYSVTATVEILVDLDAAGKITRTEIVRWAGYGLDETVEAAVREMNWRPAERNKKALAMRVLLRYNFRKPDAKP